MIRFKHKPTDIFAEITVLLIGYFLISYGANCLWHNSWAFALGCALLVNRIFKGILEN